MCAAPRGLGTLVPIGSGSSRTWWRPDPRLGKRAKSRTPRFPERCGCFLVVSEWAAAGDGDGGYVVAISANHAEANHLALGVDGEP